MLLLRLTLEVINKLGLNVIVLEDYTMCIILWKYMVFLKTYGMIWF